MVSLISIGDRSLTRLHLNSVIYLNSEIYDLLRITYSLSSNHQFENIKVIRNE